MACERQRCPLTADCAPAVALGRGEASRAAGRTVHASESMSRREALRRSVLATCRRIADPEARAQVPEVVA